MTEDVRGSIESGQATPYHHSGLCPCTCVGQQALKRGPHTFVRQQLFWGLVPQENTQHGLGLMAVPRVGVPCDTEAQQGLCR